MFTDRKVLTRQQLYEEVWTTPMMHVAKKYGHSDVGLAKHCRNLKIPLPGRGYWAKKAAGKKLPKRPPLPPLDCGLRDLPTINEWRLKREAEPPMPPPELDPEVKALLDREETAAPITLPEDLSSAHRLVRGVLKDRRLDKRNRRRSWSEPREERTWALADVHASPENFERAMKIMSALLKALESRGFQVKGDKDRNDVLSQVVILNEAFNLRICEPNRQLPHVQTDEEKAKKRKGDTWGIPKYDKVPSGELVLEMTSVDCRFTHRYRDGKRARLEEQLNDVVKGLIRSVDWARKRKAEWKREEEIRHEDERRRWEEEQRRREIEEERRREQARIDALLAEVRSWKAGQDLRAYLGEIRMAMAASGELVTPDTEVGRWLHWAGDVACRLVPQRLATRRQGGER